MPQSRARTPLLAAVVVLAALAMPSMAAAEPGTKITVRGSDFGRMLWDGRQAVYMFDQDGPGESRCHGTCARAWPPVLTDGRPRAGAGVDADLLGTAKRKSGRRQVTYAGRPLYTYAHEGRDEVLCHDVFLNGGNWWVLAPDGEPRP